MPHKLFSIAFYQPQSEGDIKMYLVASVRSFVCLPVCLSELSCLKGDHYRSEGFVCLSVISRAYADNRADVVDRLLFEHPLGKLRVNVQENKKSSESDKPKNVKFKRNKLRHFLLFIVKLFPFAIQAVCEGPSS